MAHMAGTKSRNVHEAIFDLDMLVLRAAGAAHFDTYGKSAEDAQGDEDD